MMINKDIKDITFADLLELQKQLDEEVAKPRPNGFVPRERTLLDIKLALDDEFQEWLRELPDEYNFKTWKEKEYSKEKELIELVDVLFFLLQWINAIVEKYEYVFEAFSDEFEAFGDAKTNADTSLNTLILMFKNYVYIDAVLMVLNAWISICVERGFSKEEIIQTYINKWKKNMGRIKGDWSNGV